jgi:hypothetical protein
MMYMGEGAGESSCEKSSAPVIARKKNLKPLFDVESSILPFFRELTACRLVVV